MSDRMPDRASGQRIEAVFQAQHRRLWRLAYRMTGSAEDADDAVQEAFVRLLRDPPACSEAELGRWMVRVATHLAIDLLRRRKRRAYAGPWLPEPIERPDGANDDPEARYGLAESATYAFLVALEALGPRQRAALLLRDVLGYSAEEAAAVLATSAGSVRVLHLRARRALDGYDKQRCLPTAELHGRHRQALASLLARLMAGDTPGVEALLAESVRTITDSAGEFSALSQPLVGRARVARVYLAAAAERAKCEPEVQLRTLNGLPAALIALRRPLRRQAPRSVLRVELDGDGKIELVQALLASRKLERVFRNGSASSPTSV